MGHIDPNVDVGVFYEEGAELFTVFENEFLDGLGVELDVDLQGL